MRKTQQAFTQLLREMHLQSGRSATVVAGLSGITPSYLSELLKGKKRRVSFYVLRTQLVTTIDDRLADVVLVDSSTVDAVLAADATYSALPFFERLFVQKMQVARILLDKNGRLQAVQQRVMSHGWQAAQIAPAPDIYGTWFWQSFTPLHIERMAQSADPLQTTAVDMMLTACLSGTWRAYFDLRGLIWQGEKAALRYWAVHDPEYFALVQRCMSTPDRLERVAAYRALVSHTIQPIGAPFNKGETALILEDPSKHVSHLKLTLDYWNGLFA